jgi:hypothetical protein
LTAPLRSFGTPNPRVRLLRSLCVTLGQSEIGARPSRSRRTLERKLTRSRQARHCDGVPRTRRHQFRRTVSGPPVHVLELLAALFKIVFHHMKGRQHWKGPAAFSIAMGIVAFCFVLAELIKANSVAPYPGVPPADIGSLSAATGLTIAASAIGLATLQLVMMWLQISRLDDAASSSRTNLEILGAIEELTATLRTGHPVVHNHYQTSLLSFPESRTQIYGVDRRLQSD